MNADQQRGYDFTKGVGRYLAQGFLIGLLLLGVFALLRNSGGWGLDDTDKDGWTRSGLTIHTDHKTGLQYLADGKGGLTPRLPIIVFEKSNPLHTSAMNTLLPCPFCGGKFIPDHPKMKDHHPFTSEPKLEELTEDRGWRVTCYGCGVGTWTNLRYTREQAIAAWNTRRG